MKQRRKIAVTGTAGVGGIVAETLLREGRFDLKILSMNAPADTIHRFEELGASVEQMDSWNTENIVSAITDCYALFGTTTNRPEDTDEFKYGRILIDAVKKSHIQHFVFESLPGYHAVSNGVFRVPSFDIKAQLEQYCRASGVNATYLHPAFHYENFLNGKLLKTDADGNIYFGFPQGKTAMAMCSIRDIGPLVSMIFRFPKQYVGRTVGVVADERCCDEYASLLSEMLNRKIEYRNMSNTAYLLDGGSMEWADMFDVQRIFIRSRSRELIESYGLNPAMQPFNRWVKRNKTALLEMIKSAV